MWSHEWCALVTVVVIVILIVVEAVLMVDPATTVGKFVTYLRRFSC
jgi:hypothetical protein